MTRKILSALSSRRSVYAIGNKLPVSEDEVSKVITTVVKECPSSFNSQSSRVVILFGKHHQKLWSIVKDTLRPIVPAEAFAASEKKVDSCFAAGAGTVLFFEDSDTVAGLQKQYPSYAQGFPVFSEHSSGMAQLAVWTALSEIGIGATLQHYSPLIDAAVTAEWKIPQAWKLRAQMPFGSIVAEPGEKSYIPDEGRFMIFK